MTTILITGANRGIGLEFTRQYLARGCTVIAACRNPEAAYELNALACGQLIIRALDVTSQESIDSFCGNVPAGSVSTFINNAGIYGPKGTPLGEVEPEVWTEVLRTNTIAPLILTQALFPALAPDKARLIYLSSKMGSIADNGSGGSYVYRSSKTALNQVVRSLALDLAPRGYLVAAVHPGWVKTDMGGPNALLDVQTSVSGLISVIDGLNEHGSGNFYNYDGDIIPW